MNAVATSSRGLLPPALIGQPPHVCGLDSSERDALVVHARKVDGRWVVVCLYGDQVWWLPSATTNAIKAQTKLDFGTVPDVFRETAKAMMYRLIRRGRSLSKRAGTASAVRKFSGVRTFLKFLHSLGIETLSRATPAVCYQYAERCRVEGAAGLKPSAIFNRLAAVEMVHELSHYSEDPMPLAPWPGSSADRLSGYSNARRQEGAQTPLMPNDVFEKLFQRAWSILQDAERIMDLRDHVAGLVLPAPYSRPKRSRASESYHKNKALASRGWGDGLVELRRALFRVRTAAYVVLASLSGCRNHELSFLRTDSYYSTATADGLRYWWMRSKSTKTGAGDTEWMVPEAAVFALKTMERWAKPYQEMLDGEIASLREADPLSPQIAEAQEHLGALFVGVDMKQHRLVRTLGTRQWDDMLKDFAKECGLDWPLATHQFRRKFANYAARSRFGDLRYLKEHFKHWSLDMTLHYALNEAQELALYLEVEDELEGIKESIASTWLEPDEPLGGGYGARLVNWRSRSDTVTLFKNRAHMVKSIAHSTAIRSNGHAFCSADDDLCIGNDLEPTRCSAGCENAVITRAHADIYKRLHDDLAGLLELPDIGEGGRARVRRDLQRCKNVLSDLGFTCSPESV